MEATELTQQQIELITNMARQFWARLPRAARTDVSPEDLTSVGAIEMVEKIIPGYRDGTGATFRTYAVNRLWGAFRDHLRKIDNLPRRWRQRGCEVIYDVPEFETPPDTSLDDDDAFMFLLSPLSDRNRQIMVDSYKHDMLDREIAKRHGVSTPRVSQIRTASLKKIRGEYAELCHC